MKFQNVYGRLFFGFLSDSEHIPNKDWLLTILVLLMHMNPKKKRVGNTFGQSEEKSRSKEKKIPTQKINPLSWFSKRDPTRAPKVGREYAWLHIFFAMFPSVEFPRLLLLWLRIRLACMGDKRAKWVKQVADQTWFDNLTSFKNIFKA